MSSRARRGEGRGQRGGRPDTPKGGVKHDGIHPLQSHNPTQLTPAQHNTEQRGAASPGASVRKEDASPLTCKSAPWPWTSSAQPSSMSAGLPFAPPGAPMPLGFCCDLVDFRHFSPPINVPGSRQPIKPSQAQQRPAQRKGFLFLEG